jgi:CHAT domain-containing protein
MNNVMFTARHPINALYFQPPEEIIWGRGMSLVGLGTALLSLDANSTRATEVFDRARDYFDALGFRAGNVLIETFKTHALLATGNHARAEAQAQVGIEHARKLGLLEYTWRLQALRGKALLELKRFDEAETVLRQAQSVVDLMAGTMASDDAKVRFGVGKEGITLDLIRIDLKKHDLPQLFEDMERGRARSFIALLANRTVAADRGGELVSQVRALDKTIQQERQRKVALSVEGSIDPERERNLLEQRVALVSKLRERDPDLADALAVSAVNLKTAQAALPANSLMVYAIPNRGEEPMKLLLVRRDEVKLLDLAINSAQLKDSLDRFQSAIVNADDKAQREALAPIRQALKLAEWPQAGSVFFVPSGHSHFIPWGALDIAMPVAVLPTGGWIARAPLDLPHSARVAIVGDPEFGGLLPQLPGARDEARSLAALYTVSALLGEAATEGALRQSVGKGIDVLHLATHALFDPVYPMQSALIMSTGQRAVPLTAEQLFARPLTARLVILSACETGMGQVISGDELLGLARSFYLGGASAVVSSLWPVDDEASRLFMETFHRKARDGNYGRAWLEARNTVRDKGFAPSAYGAFVLGGSLGR